MGELSLPCMASRTCSAKRPRTTTTWQFSASTDIKDAIDYGFPERRKQRAATSIGGSRGFWRTPNEGALSNYDEDGLLPPWARKQQLDKRYFEVPQPFSEDKAGYKFMAPEWSLRRPKGDAFRSKSSMNLGSTSHALDFASPPSKHYGDPKFPKTLSVDLSWRNKGLSKPTKRIYNHSRNGRPNELTFSDWCHLRVQGL